MGELKRQFWQTDNKTYLGDSVYAEFKEFVLVLTTENGLPNDPSNSIQLDPPALRALESFIKEIECAC